MTRVTVLVTRADVERLSKLGWTDLEGTLELEVPVVLRHIRTPIVTASGSVGVRLEVADWKEQGDEAAQNAG